MWKGSASRKQISTCTLVHYLAYAWTGLPGSASGKEPACHCRQMEETWVWSLGWEDPLEEDMATHSSILAWRIPWTEEPAGPTVHRVTNSRTQLKRLSTGEIYFVKSWDFIGKKLTKTEKACPQENLSTPDLRGEREPQFLGMSISSKEPTHLPSL